MEKRKAWVVTGAGAVVTGFRNYRWRSRTDVGVGCAVAPADVVQRPRLVEELGRSKRRSRRRSPTNGGVEAILANQPIAHRCRPWNRGTGNGPEE